LPSSGTIIKPVYKLAAGGVQIVFCYCIFQSLAPQVTMRKTDTIKDTQYMQ